MAITPSAPDSFPDQTDIAARELGFALARGVGRTLTDLGYAVLTEFPLKSGRRVDVIGLGRDGDFTVVEVKISLADFRSDTKWPEYLEFCDRFYFAVPEGFPQHVLPAEEGLMVADGFEAAILRESQLRRMNGNRRGHQTRKFARTAATRLFASSLA